MRNPLILAWWLGLLAALQAATLILDRFHHLAWGLVGLHLLKTCYLGFALVVFVRWLSFRSQRNFESLVETYNRVARKAFDPAAARRDSWIGPFLNLVLVVLSSIDFTLVFNWNVTVFRVSVALDLAIWILLSRWVTRTYWLKSQGARERLKEAVDDARSRAKAAEAEAEVVPRRVPKAPFAILSAVSLALSLGFASRRWNDVRGVFRVDDLKQCMDQCMRMASARFYQQGDLRFRVAGEPCMRERAGDLEIAMDFHKGELFLRAFERDTSDYFGDGVPGNEGLVLDAYGRFHRAWNSSAVPGPRPADD